MALKKIKIKNILSFDEFELEFDPRMNLILSANGGGKTNLLHVLNMIREDIVGIEVAHKMVSPVFNMFALKKGECYGEITLEIETISKTIYTLTYELEMLKSDLLIISSFSIMENDEELIKIIYTNWNGYNAPLSDIQYLDQLKLTVESNRLSGVEKELLEGSIKPDSTMFRAIRKYNYKDEKIKKALSIIHECFFSKYFNDLPDFEFVTETVKNDSRLEEYIKVSLKKIGVNCTGFSFKEVNSNNFFDFLNLVDTNLNEEKLVQLKEANKERSDMMFDQLFIDNVGVDFSLMSEGIKTFIQHLTAEYLLERFEDDRLSYIFLTDEIENGLHEFLVYNMVECYSKMDAQFIFTTHLVDLLNPKILKKEQVILLSKENNATRYKKLSDFPELREDSRHNWANWYRTHRLYGYPEIDELDVLE